MRTVKNSEDMIIEARRNDLTIDVSTLFDRQQCKNRPKVLLSCVLWEKNNEKLEEKQRLAEPLYPLCTQGAPRLATGSQAERHRRRTFWRDLRQTFWETFGQVHTKADEEKAKEEAVCVHRGAKKT